MFRFFCTLYVVLSLAGCGGSGDGNPVQPPPPPSSDTMAPSTPGNFTVDVDSDSSVAMEWDISADDVGVTGYKIYRDGTLTDTTVNTSASDTGLTTGVNYCYEVSAVDAAGNESARSSIVCATPFNTWTKRLPGVNITVTAIAYDGTRYVATGDQFTNNYVLVSEDTLSWTAIPVNVSEFSDILWADTQFIGASDRGNLYTSPDGENWTQRLMAPAFTDLSAAAWSGSMAVAVGEDGSTWSSPDGITWTERTGATSEFLNDVAWVVDTFVAVGADGTILTSTDGIAWTAQVSGTTDTFYAVTGNASTFVAASLGGGYNSADGITWAPFSASGLPNDVTWAEGLNLFVMVDTNGNINTSPDANMWTERLDADQILGLETVLWAGSRLLAGGSFAEIAVSTDAISWETRNSSFNIERVRWSNNSLYAIGGPSKLATSPDGIVWTFHRTGFRGDFHRDVATNGNRVVAAGQTYYASTPSLQQLPWPTHQFFGATSADNAVIWDGTQFVSVGTNGTLRLSSDGITHTAFTSTVTGTTNPLTGIVWDGSQYVAVGYNGTIITSPDLTAWSDRSGVMTANLRDLAYSGGRFVAVGDGGTTLYSDNGIDWNAGTSGTTQTLFGVAWAGDEFVTVGNGATIRRSADGVTWTTFPGSTPLTNYRGVAYTGAQIVVGGNNGLIATLEKP